MKTKLWRPLFGKKSAPYPDPNALFFQCFVLNAGKHVNQGTIQKKNQRALLNEAQKIFARLRRANFSFSFWCPISKLPPFNLGLDPPLGSICMCYKLTFSFQRESFALLCCWQIETSLRKLVLVWKLFPSKLVAPDDSSRIQAYTNMYMMIYNACNCSSFCSLKTASKLYSPLLLTTLTCLEKNFPLNCRKNSIT